MGSQQSNESVQNNAKSIDTPYQTIPIVNGLESTFYVACDTHGRKCDGIYRPNQELQRNHEHLGIEPGIKTWFGGQRSTPKYYETIKNNTTKESMTNGFFRRTLTDSLFLDRLDWRTMTVVSDNDKFFYAKLNRKTTQLYQINRDNCIVKRIEFNTSFTCHIVDIVPYRGLHLTVIRNQLNVFYLLIVGTKLHFCLGSILRVKIIDNEIYIIRDIGDHLYISHVRLIIDPQNDQQSKNNRSDHVELVVASIPLVLHRLQLVYELAYYDFFKNGAHAIDMPNQWTAIVSPHHYATSTCPDAQKIYLHSTSGPVISFDLYGWNAIKNKFKCINDIQRFALVDGEYIIVTIEFNDSSHQVIIYRNCQYVRTITFAANGQTPKLPLCFKTQELVQLLTIGMRDALIPNLTYIIQDYCE